MYRPITRSALVYLLLIMSASGALFGWAVGRVAGVSAHATTDGQTGASLSVPNAPAVTQALLTSDTLLWPVASGNVEGVTYSFHYPTNWTSSLLYCAPISSNKNSKEGGHLPTGCASTDILVGQKAIDIGRIASGSTLIIDGKSARRSIQTHPANDLVSQVYTTMVYSASGTPLFGFTTQVGPATDRATLDAITAALDAMAGTIQVEAR